MRYQKALLLVALLVASVAVIGAGCGGKSRVPHHAGSPIIEMNIDYGIGGGPLGGQENLAIYEDGTVIYAEQKGFTRIWRTGQLQTEELSNLVKFFQDSNFNGLKTSYSWPCCPSSDVHLTISISYQGMTKTVRAYGYLTSDDGVSYPDMPYPLNDIYMKLRDIAQNKTEEVARETIS